MKARFVIKVFLTSLFSMFILGIYAQGFGIFENSNDVGNPKLAGKTVYDPTKQLYTLTGGGANIWGTNDQFQYVWKRESGNFSMSTKFEWDVKGITTHRKVGIMLRESLEADARHVIVTVHGDGLTSLQYRSQKGGPTREIVGPKDANYVTLERTGNKVLMKTATDNLPQNVTGEVELDMRGSVYLGLFICSHDADKLETVHYSNVEYRQLPGMQGAAQPSVSSILEILDVTTGKRTVVKEFANTRMEAPNWTPDGKWLVYNQGGKLYKISPSGGEPQLINTDFVTRCNNDHVITFDGKYICISAGPVEGGGSRVYTMPFSGGIPRLITPVGPSYLHGVSPDNKFLAYCADRNGNFDVYIVPFEGGVEKRLTTAEGLDDGPEYSPDGKYIWFNSVRTGLMQVWRMKADGSEQTQMTFDETRNSWFPHVSPDGKQVLFITYYKGDLEPGQHLANKNVELRIMPSTGGEPKTLVKLFGGQGTINVNSWAPDSKRLAFVSYRLN
jgi:Tol biopolymer transport system component